MCWRSVVLTCHQSFSQSVNRKCFCRKWVVVTCHQSFSQSINGGLHLQETGGGHLPCAASLLAQLVPCAQPDLESQIVTERFVPRLLSACLRYPCANALHCATMQLVR